MRKIVYGVLVLGVALLGFGVLSAATNKVAIVDRNTKINWFGSEKNAAYLTNVINEQKSKLSEGTVVVDVTIHNTLDTEIIYAIDNGKSMSAYKNELIEKIKSIATTLENINGIKQGISLTTDGSNTFIDLDDENIAIQLNTIKSVASSTTKDGEIFSAIEKAKNEFSTNSKNKILVVFTSKWDALTAEEITNYKNLIDTVAVDTDIIVYGIDNESVISEFNQIFDSSTRNAIGTDINLINYTNNVLLTLPTVKENVAAKISFDKSITDNFDIKNINISKSVSNTYNEQDRTITFGAVTIDQNEDLVISYTLQVKDDVDSSIVDTTPIRTNRQIVLTGDINAQLPENSKIDDICSPTIMILSETSDNPYTGTIDYIIFASCMLAVALITLVIMNSRKSFNRI